MILGIDEVGRGPWAGPLVVGAVVLGGAEIAGLTDSKKLSKKRREELDAAIRMQAACGLGWVHADEIDAVGLSEALRLATKRAVEQIGVPYHEIVIDGTINFLADTTKGEYVTTMKKADLLVPSVSAASIIAKVARDRYMAEQDAVYEGYKFGAHVGYGTAAHRAAIEKLGVTPLHRLSFAPLQKYRREYNDRSPTTVSGQDGFAPGPIRASASDRTRAADISTQKGRSTFSSAALPVATHAGVGGDTSGVRPSNFMGAIAEEEAANYLVLQGHEIIERNWKTKYCEIDIVSHRDGTVYFTEVKYRKQANQGGGLAAITPKKLRQMQFAAKVYIQAQQIKDTDLLLAAISLTGEPPEAEEFVLV